MFSAALILDDSSIVNMNIKIRLEDFMINTMRLNFTKIQSYKYKEKM